MNNYLLPRVAPWIKNLPAMQETQADTGSSLAQEDSLEEDMATHSMENPHGWRILVGYSP